MLDATAQLATDYHRQVEEKQHTEELTQAILKGMEWFLIDLSIADMQWDRFCAGDTDLARYAVMESLIEFIEN